VTLHIVEHVGRTDVGRQRSVNEDSLVLAPPFFAVADGMGGAKAGEVASAMAAETFEGEADSGEPAEAQLTRILREANRRIYDLAVSDDSHRGMGTTVTAAKVTGNEVSLGHVGDSRAYRLRDGELEQLTRDHSLVAELERSGQITPEAAEHHPQRSIITRALGPEGEVAVDHHTWPARDGDVFLICSDGLTSMVEDDVIREVVERRRDDLDAAARELVEKANRSGGEDNITVVFFEVDPEEEPSEETEDTVVRAGLRDNEDTMDESDGQPPIAVVEPKRRGRTLPILGALAVLLIIAAAVLWLLGQS
jgi:protein phosphatase